MQKRLVQQFGKYTKHDGQYNLMPAQRPCPIFDDSLFFLQAD